MHSEASVSRDDQMTLPDPVECQREFERRGFISVQAAMCAAELSALIEITRKLIGGFAVTVDRPGEKRLSYAVVTGDRIRSDARPLFDVYAAGPLLAWVRSVTGFADLSVSPHICSAINVNCLSLAGQRYPWHTDAVPFTALLFLSSLKDTDGGQLLIKAADSTSVVEIQPARGLLILMDGSRCPHAVAPLRTHAIRLTVPMVYPARLLPRPAGLDDFLYGARSSARAEP